jgi:hypothetical protein
MSETLADRIIFRAPPSIGAALRDEAVTQGVTVSEVIRRRLSGTQETAAETSRGPMASKGSNSDG